MRIFDILFKDDIGLFVKHKIMQNFSMNLLNIFIPIYFYTVGFSLVEIFAWFFLSVFSGILLFQYGGLRLANRIGAKNTVLVASLFYVVFLLMLVGIKSFPQIFFISALIYSVWDSFYFIQREALFMESAKDGYRGFTEGTLSSLEQIASMVAVFIGALLLVYSGIFALVGVAIILFLLSIYPVYLMKNISFKAGYSLRNLFHKKDAILYSKMVARTFQRDCLFILWPLYIFIYGLDIISIGVVGSVMFIGSILIGIISGRLSDINDDVVMRLSAIGTFVFWLVLVFFKSNAVIFSVSFTLNLFLMSLYLSVYTKAVNIGAKTSPSRFAFSMMFVENIGSALLFLYVIAVLILAADLKTVFILSSLSSVVFFIKDRK